MLMPEIHLLSWERRINRECFGVMNLALHPSLDQRDVLGSRDRHEPFLVIKCMAPSGHMRTGFSITDGQVCAGINFLNDFGDARDDTIVFHGLVSKPLRKVHVHRLRRQRRKFASLSVSVRMSHACGLFIFIYIY